MQKFPYRKLISGITCMLFLCSDAASAAPAAAIQLRPSRETPAYLQIEIPEELASLEDIYEAPAKFDPRLVLHIQTVHANYQAQVQIKKLLTHLYEKYQFNTLFVEGAAGELNPDYLKMFPDPENNVRLADAMTQKGELTGADFYMVDAPEDVTAIGIEQPELYRGNYTAFKKVYGSKDRMDHFMSKLSSRLEQLSSRFFSNDMRRILSEWNKFGSGHREFLPFAQQLAKEAGKYLNLDLNSLFAQVEWPQLTRLLVLQSMESDLDRRAAEKEKQSLLEFLKSKNISPEIIQGIENLEDKKINMNRLSQDGEESEFLPRKLLERLVEAAEPYGFHFHEYPHFSLYAGYMILKSEVDSKVLFDEIEKLFEKILNELAVSEREKNLLELYRDTDLLKKLMSLELSRKEWSRATYRREWINLQTLIQRIEGINDHVVQDSQASIPQELNDVFSAAFDFYDFAWKREAAFYETIKKEMSERKIEKAILITGGFHTEGLMQMFRDDEVSYGILTPRISQLASKNDYVATMMEKHPTIFDLAQLEIPTFLAGSQVRGVLGADQIGGLKSKLDVYFNVMQSLTFPAERQGAEVSRHLNFLNTISRTLENPQDWMEFIPVEGVPDTYFIKVATDDGKAAPLRNTDGEAYTITIKPLPQGDGRISFSINAGTIDVARLGDAAFTPFGEEPSEIGTDLNIAGRNGAVQATQRRLTPEDLEWLREGGIDNQLNAAGPGTGGRIVTVDDDDKDPVILSVPQSPLQRALILAGLGVTPFIAELRSALRRSELRTAPVETDTSKIYPFGAFDVAIYHDQNTRLVNRDRAAVERLLTIDAGEIGIDIESTMRIQGIVAPLDGRMPLKVFVSGSYENNTRRIKMVGRTPENIAVSLEFILGVGRSGDTRLKKVRVYSEPKYNEGVNLDRLFAAIETAGARRRLFSGISPTGVISVTPINLGVEIDGRSPEGYLIQEAGNPDSPVYGVILYDQLIDSTGQADEINFAADSFISKLRGMDREERMATIEFQSETFKRESVTFLKLKRAAARSTSDTQVINSSASETSTSLPAPAPASARRDASRKPSPKPAAPAPKKAAAVQKPKIAPQRQISLAAISEEQLREASVEDLMEYLVRARPPRYVSAKEMKARRESYSASTGVILIDTPLGPKIVKIPQGIAKRGKDQKENRTALNDVINIADENIRLRVKGELDRRREPVPSDDELAAIRNQRAADEEAKNWVPYLWGLTRIPANSPAGQFTIWLREQGGLFAVIRKGLQRSSQVKAVEKTEEAPDESQAKPSFWRRSYQSAADWASRTIARVDPASGIQLSKIAELADRIVLNEDLKDAAFYSTEALQEFLERDDEFEYLEPKEKSKFLPEDYVTLSGAIVIDGPDTGMTMLQLTSVWIKSREQGAALAEAVNKLVITRVEAELERRGVLRSEEVDARPELRAIGFRDFSEKVMNTLTGAFAVVALSGGFVPDAEASLPVTPAVSRFASTVYQASLPSGVKEIEQIVASVSVLQRSDEFGFSQIIRPASMDEAEGLKSELRLMAAPLVTQTNQILHVIVTLAGIRNFEVIELQKALDQVAKEIQELKAVDGQAINARFQVTVSDEDRLMPMLQRSQNDAYGTAKNNRTNTRLDRNFFKEHSLRLFVNVTERGVELAMLDNGLIRGWTLGLSLEGEANASALTSSANVYAMKISQHPDALDQDTLNMLDSPQNQSAIYNNNALRGTIATITAAIKAIVEVRVAA